MSILSNFDQKIGPFFRPPKNDHFQKMEGQKTPFFLFTNFPHEIGGYKNTLLTRKGLKYPTLFSILPSSPNEIGILGGVPDFDPFFRLF
jgi:hypothetical protein